MQIVNLIADIVIIVLVALIVAIGVKRGFVKSIVGLVSTVLVLAVAIFATTPLTGLITAGTDWDDQLATKIATPLRSKLPNSSAVVYYSDFDNDPDTELQLVYSNNGGVDEYEFAEILDDNVIISKLGLAKLLQPSAEKLLQNQAESEGYDIDNVDNKVEFIDCVTYPIATIVFTAAVFIVLLILSRILIWIMLKIFKKIVSRFYVAHFFDKMLGGIFGLAMAALIVLIILALLKLLAPLGFMEPVNNYISGTVVTGFIYNNNFLYDLIAKYINIADLLSKIGA